MAVTRFHRTCRSLWPRIAQHCDRCDCTAHLVWPALGYRPLGQQVRSLQLGVRSRPWRRGWTVSAPKTWKQPRTAFYNLWTRRLVQCSKALPGTWTMSQQMSPYMFPENYHSNRPMYLWECGVSCGPCKKKERLVGGTVLSHDLETVCRRKLHDNTIESLDAIGLEITVFWKMVMRMGGRDRTQSQLSMWLFNAVLSVA